LFGMKVAERCLKTRSFGKKGKKKNRGRKMILQPLCRSEKRGKNPEDSQSKHELIAAVCRAEGRIKAVRSVGEGVTEGMGSNIVKGKNHNKKNRLDSTLKN